MYIDVDLNIFSDSDEYFYKKCSNLTVVTTLTADEKNDLIVDVHFVPPPLFPIVSHLLHLLNEFIHADLSGL
jgi:hypothetical protein